MSMSNLSSRHLGFFPKGLAYDFGSKFPPKLNIVDSFSVAADNSSLVRVDTFSVTSYQSLIAQYLCYIYIIRWYYFYLTVVRSSGIGVARALNPT